VKVINAFLADERSLTLVERDARGNRKLKRVLADWVAYFDERQLTDRVKRELHTSQFVRAAKSEGNNWLRVCFVSRVARAMFCNGAESVARAYNFTPYEADVEPAARWAVDNSVQFAAPNRVYLDLEWDSRVPFSRKEEARLLTWALVDEEGSRSIGVLQDDTDACERELLDALWCALESYDQVAAWSGDGADFPVLFARSRDRGCTIDARLWLWIDFLEVYERMNKQAAESGEEKSSLKLEDVARVKLGEGKIQPPDWVISKFGNRPLGAITWHMWEAGGEARRLLVQYNLRDTELLRKLEQKTGYLSSLSTLCEVCHVPANTNGLNPTRQMDGFMLALGLQRGFHFPTKKYRDGGEKFAGAYVMEPSFKGVARNVHVADFASLYPSIIRTWNVSPETKLGKVAKGELRGEWDVPHCVSPLTGIAFRTDIEGILPAAVAEMIAKRKFWADKQASLPPYTPEWHDARRRSLAYKTAANSFYGVLGNIYSRFFDRELAESVTQNGVWLIKKTIELAEAA
jgi:DNA polymerase elongation subunit (family B)